MGAPPPDAVDAEGLEWDAAYGFGAGEGGDGAGAEMVGTAAEVGAELARYLASVDPEFLSENGVRLVLKVGLVVEEIR